DRRRTTDAGPRRSRSGLAVRGRGCEMSDLRDIARRLRDISDGCEGRLASTVTRGPVHRPPKITGPMVNAWPREIDGTEYRFAVEAVGNAVGQLWPAVDRAAKQAGRAIDDLILAAHDATGCDWRQIPS